MPTRRRRPAPRPHGGLFTVFGVSINFNAIATTIGGLVTWGLLSLVWHSVKTNAGYVHAIPQIQAEVAGVKEDVKGIKAEQARVKREYAPPVAKE
jgi:hypothetical protein